MHATLIFVLGPWALDHSHGVLIWNLLLIVQAYVLMIKPEWSERLNEQDRDQLDSESSKSNRVGSWIVCGVVLSALVAPLLERFGYWDHWTSWSLYSPHTSRVEIELHRSAVDTLPSSLRTFVEEDDNGDGWRKLAIERWSLGSRGVPIYPQARYQLALAEQIATQLRLTDEILRSRARCIGSLDGPARRTTPPGSRRNSRCHEIILVSQTGIVLRIGIRFPSVEGCRRLYRAFRSTPDATPQIAVRRY